MATRGSKHNYPTHDSGYFQLDNLDTRFCAWKNKKEPKTICIVLLRLGLNNQLKSIKLLFWEMYNCFGKTPEHKCSILPLSCDAQLPEFVVTPLSPIGLSKWVVMMMMNCFCGMVDRWKAFERSSPSRISDTPRADLNLRRTWVQALLNEVVQRW